MLLSNDNAEGRTVEPRYLELSREVKNSVVQEKDDFKLVES